MFFIKMRNFNKNEIVLWRLFYIFFHNLFVMCHVLNIDEYYFGDVLAPLSWLHVTYRLRAPRALSFVCSIISMKPQCYFLKICFCQNYHWKQHVRFKMLYGYINRTLISTKKIFSVYMFEALKTLQNALATEENITAYKKLVV